MVYSGSIGLHHVIADLKQQKLASGPYNDMQTIEIRSLETPDAESLAARLLEEEGVRLDHDTGQAVCRRIVELTDAVPFYIENVCGRLAECKSGIGVNDVDKTVTTQLASDHDPWEMEQFRSRLKIYYSGTTSGANGERFEDATIARAILDHLAVENTPQSIEQIWALCKSQFPLTDRQHIIELLQSLALDHYLRSDQQKRYAFRFPLIRTWWLQAQGLAP